MFRKSPRILLLLAVLSYLLRWAGIRLMGSEKVLQATPLHVGILALLLFASAWKEKRTLLWMVGAFILCAATAWIVVYSGGSANAPRNIASLIIGLEGMVVLAGICSFVSLATVPFWQKIIGAVVLACAFGWLLAPLGAPLGYWTYTPDKALLSFFLAWAIVSVVAAASWFALRLKAFHFAIALFLMEVVFLALLRV